MQSHSREPHVVKYAESQTWFMKRMLPHFDNIMSQSREATVTQFYWVTVARPRRGIAASRSIKTHCIIVYTFLQRLPFKNVISMCRILSKNLPTYWIIKRKLLIFYKIECPTAKILDIHSLQTKLHINKHNYELQLIA